jgi:hypothetical protein
MNDDEKFLLYCELHAATDEALFHRQDVVRVYTLAGQTLRGEHLPAWIAVRPAIMNPLVAAARARLARASSTPPPP